MFFVNHPETQRFQFVNVATTVFLFFFGGQTIICYIHQQPFFGYFLFLTTRSILSSTRFFDGWLAGWLATLTSTAACKLFQLSAILRSKHWIPSELQSQIAQGPVSTELGDCLGKLSGADNHTDFSRRALTKKCFVTAQSGVRATGFPPKYFWRRNRWNKRNWLIQPRPACFCQLVCCCCSDLRAASSLVRSCQK